MQETKQYENNIVELEIEQKKAKEKLNEGQRILRENEDAIPDIKKQIMEAELIKYHVRTSLYTNFCKLYIKSRL